MRNDGLMNCKKIILTLCIVHCALCIVSAQPRLLQPEMYIGLQGGPIFTWTRFAPDVPGAKEIKSSTLLSGTGGLVFRYIGHKYCGLQVEVNYLQRGWRESIDDNGLNVHYRRELNYIEIPFLAHIWFGKKAVRGFFNVGPQIGYCFYEKSSGTEHPTIRYQYEKLDYPFDWGLTGGLGMLVRTKKAGTWQLEARFAYSFNDYFKNGKADYFQNSNPLTLAFTAGYLWEIKKK